MTFLPSCICIRLIGLDTIFTATWSHLSASSSTFGRRTTRTQARPTTNRAPRAQSSARLRHVAAPATHVSAVPAAAADPPEAGEEPGRAQRRKSGAWSPSARRGRESVRSGARPPGGAPAHGVRGHATRGAHVVRGHRARRAPAKNSRTNLPAMTAQGTGNGSARTAGHGQRLQVTRGQGADATSHTARRGRGRRCSPIRCGSAHGEVAGATRTGRPWGQAPWPLRLGADFPVAAVGAPLARVERCLLYVRALYEPEKKKKDGAKKYEEERGSSYKDTRDKVLVEGKI